MLSSAVPFLWDTLLFLHLCLCGYLHTVIINADAQLCHFELHFGGSASSNYMTGGEEEFQLQLVIEGHTYSVPVSKLLSSATFLFGMWKYRAQFVP